MDGDGQHNPEFIRKMLQVLQEKNVNMVIGSRFIENQVSILLRATDWNFIFEKLIKILTGQKVTDPTSGLRVADRKVIENLLNNIQVIIQNQRRLCPLNLRLFRCRSTGLDERTRTRRIIDYIK